MKRSLGNGEPLDGREQLQTHSSSWWTISTLEQFWNRWWNGSLILKLYGRGYVKYSLIWLRIAISISMHTAMENFKARFKTVASQSKIWRKKPDSNNVKICQKERFSEETLVLHPEQEVSSHLRKLNPVTHIGVLRVDGRLSRAAMPEECKQLAILPKDNHMA